MIHLWRDPVSGQYGLQQIQRKVGSFSHWAPLADDIKPDQINDHGTMVILLGNVLSDDTLQPPKEAASPSRWVARYLNTRYFMFGGRHDAAPVRAGSTPAIGHEQPGSRHRSEGVSRCPRGVVWKRAAGGRNRELVDPEGRACSEPKLGHIASNGHMAALYQDELYEMVTARGGVARLQQFGVVFGYMRVVIYVEPAINGSHQVVANTAARISCSTMHHCPGRLADRVPRADAGGDHCPDGRGDRRSDFQRSPPGDKESTEAGPDLFKLTRFDGLRLARSRSRATRSAARRRRCS